MTTTVTRAWPTFGRSAGRWLGRVVVMPFVVVAAGMLVAVGLLPMVGGAGAAVKRLDEKLFAGSASKITLPALPERSVVYAADGSVLATLFLDENRESVSLDQVNPETRHAVLAIEDHKFYEHGAVDASSILRAAIANLRAGHIVQGGSTISQQLIKNTETGNAQTFARKFQEAQDAILLEKEYSKDQILELYLNTIYFGHRVYGIATAAEYYFDVRVEKLSIPQAATLAGIISAPVLWDPVAHPDTATARRDQVLQDMLRYGWLTPQQYHDAVFTKLKLSKKGRIANTVGTEPYWVSYVVNEFERNRRFGRTLDDRRRLLFQGGLKIYTTLQPKLQSEARSVMQRHLPHSGPAPPSDPQAAIVTVVPQTGAIEAMVGGTDYSKQKIDLASQGARSTGSAFKAYTLVAAMEQGVPPGRVYSSKSPASVPKCPQNGGPWQPYNAEGAGDLGYMNLWEATAQSINVVFAQLIADVGPTNVQKAARAMGLTGYVPAVCSITLGAVSVSPLAMTTAYSTLANNGVHCGAHSIARILDSNGTTVFTAKPSCRRVVPADVSAQVTAMLEGVVTHGTGTAAAIGRPVAGKTGTGQDFQDAWFMGYVPQLTTGVWVGYSKAEIPMRSLRVLGGGEAFGGSIAAPIWHDYMAQAVTRLPVRQFPAPPAQKTGTIPDVTGLSKQDAEDTLTKANFVPIESDVTSSKPDGTVVSEDPAGGSTAVLGSGVHIGISNGKGKPKNGGSGSGGTVVVPDVVGERQSQATTDLESDGFVVKAVSKDVTDQHQDGVVLGESPPAGSKAKRGSTVTITVGKFAGGNGGGGGGGGAPGAAPRPDAVIAAQPPRRSLTIV